MNAIFRRLSASLLFALCASNAHALREGDPDPAFNGGQNVHDVLSAKLSGDQPPAVIGFARSTINDTYLAAIAYQDSVGSNFSTELYRFLPSGQPDTSFNSSGEKLLFQLPDYVMQAMAVDASNDDIVVVGGSQYFSSDDLIVCRYSAGGAVDNNLIGHNGVGCIFFDLPAIGGSTAAVVDVHTVAVQSWDHRIVVAGDLVQNNGTTVTRSMFVMRLFSTGALDTGFAGTSGVKIYNFGLNGGTASGAYALAFDASHRIVTAGYTENGTSSNSDFAALRLTTAGAIDSTCGAGTSACVATFDFHLSGNYEDSAAAILIDSPLPVIYLAGTTEAGSNPTTHSGLFATSVIRLEPNFSVDTTYGNGGKFYDFMEGNDSTVESNQYPGMAIDGNGRLMLAAGNLSHIAAWRLLASGASDGSYGNGTMPQTGRVSVTAPPNGGTGEYAKTPPQMLMDGDKPVIAAVTGVAGNPGAVELSVARLLGANTIFSDDFEQ